MIGSAGALRVFNRYPSTFVDTVPEYIYCGMLGSAGVRTSVKRATSSNVQRVFSFFASQKKKVEDRRYEVRRGPFCASTGAEETY